jgi:trans-L-3-hydroxyproline dehydratase
VVTFRNVSSFVLARSVAVTVPGIGDIECDIAFGGAFYAYVDASALGIQPVPHVLTETGDAITRAVSAAMDVGHPSDDDLSFLYGTILVLPAETRGRHSRHVCIFADRELDRSPTGTGVSGRAALLSASGSLPSGSRIEIECITGESLGVRIARSARVGPYEAVVPEVDGIAYVVGTSRWIFDPRDPLLDGFLLQKPTG